MEQRVLLMSLAVIHMPLYLISSLTHPDRGTSSCTLSKFRTEIRRNGPCSYRHGEPDWYNLDSVLYCYRWETWDGNSGKVSVVNYLWKKTPTTLWMFANEIARFKFIPIRAQKIRISWKKVNIFCHSFQKVKWYRFITQSEIFQAFISKINMIMAYR